MAYGVMDYELKSLLKDLLTKTAKKVDRTSFSQEPHYTAAFFGKLHNEVLTSSSGHTLKLSFSASNDRGRGSAESKTGIDIGMVFKWLDEENNVVFEKAIFAQAKNNLLISSRKNDSELIAQCLKMSGLTSSYITLDCPYDLSVPKICQSKKTPPFWKEESPIDLGDYLCDIVFECHDGDTTPDIIKMAKLADRSLSIETTAPRPEKALKQKPRSNSGPRQ